jgi:hypothetical protein
MSTSEKERIAEEADDYPYIVARLAEHRRVIECSSDIQWIVQDWIGNRWRSQCFYRRSQYLNRDYGPNKVLAALPPMYVEGRRKSDTERGGDRFPARVATGVAQSHGTRSHHAVAPLQMGLNNGNGSGEDAA